MTTNDFAKLLDQKLTPITQALINLSARVRTVEDQLDDKPSLMLLRSQLDSSENHLAVISDKLSKVSSDLSQKIDNLSNESSIIQKQISHLQSSQVNIAKDLKKFMKDTDKNFNIVEDRFDKLFNSLDKNMMEDRKRLDRLEHKVGLPKLDSWQLAKL